jgi:hypothetical protein
MLKDSADILKSKGNDISYEFYNLFLITFLLVFSKMCF